MKKIIIGIIFLIALGGILSYIFLNKAEAALIHNVEVVSSSMDSDGHEIRVYNLYFIASSNIEINHVEGYIDMAGYNLVSFDVKEDFVKEKLDLDTYEFSFTSNHVYSEEDGKVVYATITVKRNDETECHFLFHPNKASKEKTNDITITKTAVSNTNTSTKLTETSEGDIFYYQITLKNNSIIPTDNVVLEDNIPKEFEILNTDGGTKNNNTITWNIGSMAVNEERVFNVKVRTKENNTNANINVTNTATLTVGETKKDASTDIEILYSNIEIVKSVNKEEIRPGDTFTYTLTIANSGTGTSKNITVTDILDDNLTLINSNMTYSNNNNEYTFDIGSLDAGEEIYINLEVRLNRTSTKESISNIATATEEGKPPTEDEITIPVVDSNIIIEKTASKKEVRVGDTFTYEIKVSNNGNSASRPIVVSDNLDSRLEFVSASVGNISNNTYNYIIDSLGIDESITILLTVKVKNTAQLDDQIINIATAEEDGKDPVSSKEEIEVYDSEVTISKTASKSVVNINEEFTYTITVKNISAYDSRQITISDTIDSSLTIVDAPSATINGNTLTFNVGVLTSGETKTYKITVKAKKNVSDNTEVLNTAILKEIGKEDKKAEAEVTIVKPNLNITKTAVTSTNTKLVRPNDEFTYEIVVSNTGNGASGQITITDTISNNLTILDAEDGLINGNTITWNINSIGAHTSISKRVCVRVKEDTAVNTVIPNEVILTHGDEELKDDDDVTVTDSFIVLNKTASVDRAKKNDSFFYTITIQNIGTEIETNLKITDQIPKELSIVDISTPAKVTTNLNNNLATFNISSISVGETIEIRIYVKVIGNVKEHDIIKNTAILTYNDKTLESSDNVEIIDSNLKVEKTASKEYMSINEEINYTITITNNGSASAINVEVMDTFDEDLEIMNSNNGTLDHDNHTITWNINEIKAGETTKLTITAKLKNTNKSKVLNSVIVKEPEKEDKEDEVEVNIGKPTLNIYKEASVEEAMKGDEFLYYITIENNSNFNATNLTLTDLIDERLTILESDGGLISDNNITWTFNLSSNSQITFTIKVRVLENAQEGEISNIAILHQEEDISSNEVIVKIVDIINPQTGSILKYSFLVICIALTIIMIIYTKRKRKIFKI